MFQNVSNLGGLQAKPMTSCSSSLNIKVTLNGSHVTSLRNDQRAIFCQLAKFQAFRIAPNLLEGNCVDELLRLLFIPISVYRTIDGGGPGKSFTNVYVKGSFGGQRR